MSTHEHAGRNYSRMLLSVFGLLFLLAALLYNELLLGLFYGDPPLAPRTVAGVRGGQIEFASIGAVLLGAAALIAKVPRLDALTRRNWVGNALLAVLPAASLLLVLEIGLRPVVRAHENLTTIFEPDDALGWKLRPGAEGVWGGVRVAINAKGLRGPMLEYVKPAGVTRILYLGDSVTFGYGIGDVAQTYPYLIESLLEQRLELEIETVNAGVGGYSPWQHLAFLENEAIRYAPDLIVVSFVLNDVTEKYDLVRFGGNWMGWQLQNTVTGPLDRLRKGSSILTLSRRLIARLRFGSDVQQGAREQQALDVLALATQPDRADVRRAWASTLDELTSIYDYAASRDIPAVLVVFPFTFQLDDPEGLASPQRVVTRHAIEHGVPAIDLLPPLAALVERGEGPEDLFLDEDHPSEHGSRVIAQQLAQRLITLGLIAPARHGDSEP